MVQALNFIFLHVQLLYSKSFNSILSLVITFNNTNTSDILCVYPRLDFYAEKANEKFLIEVKVCTLERDKIGYFPDAVSARAAKHEKELSKAVQIGYHAATAFVIQMNEINEVQANVDKDTAFAEAYKGACENGVETWFFCCQVEADSIEITDRFIKTDCIIAKC